LPRFCDPFGVVGALFVQFPEVSLRSTSGYCLASLRDDSNESRSHVLTRQTCQRRWSLHRISPETAAWLIWLHRENRELRKDGSAAQALRCAPCSPFLGFSFRFALTKLAVGGQCKIQAAIPNQSTSSHPNKTGAMHRRDQGGHPNAAGKAAANDSIGASSQPGGLPDSSRRSEQRGDLRPANHENICTLKGCKNIQPTH